MKVVGITGGIGSGKSIVCKIFSQLGVPVYEADAEAKDLYTSNPELNEKIRKEISEDVFDKKGRIDKQKFSKLIFNDDSLLQKVNKLVHPFVLKHFEEWCLKHSDDPYVLKEAAILFESGANKGCDKIITLVAPVELRIQRTMKRDKRSRQEIDQIIDRQMSDEEKIKRSDFVITNDEKELVIPQVLEIHGKLLEV